MARRFIRDPDAARSGFRTRQLVRLASLLVILFFLVVLILRTKDPRRWQWLHLFAANPEPPAAKESPPPAARPGPEDQILHAYALQACAWLALAPAPAQPAASLAGTIGGGFALEQVPYDYQVEPPALQRRSPRPDSRLLAGAQDGEPFLVELPGATLPTPHRLDADARYHLIELVRQARAEDLAADARRGVRYTALREKPQDFRGDVIHVEGELLWVKTFELNRPIPGVPHVYEGLLTLGRPDHGVLVLFLDLPPGFPPAAAWGQLYLRDVRFDGYYLKTFREENSRDPSRPRIVPVLVGRTLRLPTPAPSGGIPPLLWLLGGAAALALILGGLVVWLNRAGDRRHEERMKEIRRRAADRERPPPELGQQ